MISSLIQDCNFDLHQGGASASLQIDIGVQLRRSWRQGVLVYLLIYKGNRMTVYVCVAGYHPRLQIPYLHFPLPAASLLYECHPAYAPSSQSSWICCFVSYNRYQAYPAT